MDIEILKCEKESFHPIVDFEGFRVAIFNYAPQWEINNISYFQKHDETDEIFVLLDGECTLITAGNETQLSNLKKIKMEPYTIYNVKKGVWHTHILEKGTKVLIVEKPDTTDENSPCIFLNDEEKENIIKGW